MMVDQGQNPLSLPPLPEVRGKKEKKKIEIKEVEKDYRRRGTLKKRRDNIIKKADELREAIGVDVAAVIYSPGEDSPVVYPDVEVAQAACRDFMRLPVADRALHMRTHQQFLQEMLAKKLKRIENKYEEIEENETTIQLYRALEGGDMAGVDLQRKKKMMEKIDKMILELYPKSSMAQSSTPPNASALAPLPEQLSGPIDDNSGFADGHH